MRATLALVLASLAVLAAAPGAHAVPVLEGEARFKLGGQKLKLPIVRGQLDDISGALRLQGRPVLGGRRLRGLVVEFTRRGAITARVGKLRRKVFALDARAAVRRHGRSPRIRLTGIRVRPVGVLKGRARAGELAIAAAPRFLRFAGGRSELALSQAFRDAVEGAGATVGAGPGATVTEEGAYAFPIADGRIVFGERIRGKIDHGGGITFSENAAPVLRLTDFLIAIRRGRTAGRADDGDRADLFRTPLQPPSFARGIATWDPVPVALTAPAAALLNERLETDAFAKGLEVGVMIVRAAID